MAIALDNLCWLNRMHSQARQEVGENAFFLHYLMQKGYPVLPGVAISGAAMRQFLESIPSTEPLLADLPNSSLHVDVDNYRQLQAVAQGMRQDLMAAPLSKEWVTALAAAVEEMAATAIAFHPSLGLRSQRASQDCLQLAGVMESRYSWADATGITWGLKAAWAELFRAKSLFCWQRYGVQLPQLNLAVVVQPVRAAIAAGSIYGNAERLGIRATWGLKLALDRGLVVPDVYQVDTATGAAIAQELGKKTVVCNLAELERGNGPSLPEQERCLSINVLEEAKQRQYALTTDQVSELIALARNAIADLTAVESYRRSTQAGIVLNWMLCPSESGTVPQFYLAQVSPALQHFPPLKIEHSRETQPLASPFSTPLSAAIPSVVRGLAASPGRIVAQAQVIRNPQADLKAAPPGRILVASTITPDWLPWLRQAAGIVAEQGGMTSHSAIVARELGIPAVVGAAAAMKYIQTSDSLLLDGDRGMVYPVATQIFDPVADSPQIDRGKQIESFFSQRQETTPPATPTVGGIEDYQAKLAAAIAAANSPLSVESQPTATQLMVNLSQASAIQPTIALPIDGVGLLRSELLLLGILAGRHPTGWLKQGRQEELIERLAAEVSQFTRAFFPRPIFYRSLDWRSHELQMLTDGPAEPAEPNPALGTRGTFRYQLDPTMFDLELAALAQVQQTGGTNLRLLLPFVRTVEEFSFCRRRAIDAGLTQLPQFQLWIAAEVPSVLFLLPDYVQAGVQGISIGSNDLTQLLMGADRDRADLAATFNESHPAVQRAIAQLIRLAQSSGIPCAICGQAPVLYPELIDSLVRWGINAISVNVEAVERTHAAIVRAERQLLLEAARKELETPKSG